MLNKVPRYIYIIIMCTLIIYIIIGIVSNIRVTHKQDEYKNRYYNKERLFYDR